MFSYEATDRIIKTAFKKNDWRQKAHCSQLTLLFYSDKLEHIALARQVCDDCPVANQCRDFAIQTNQDYGIWGGLTIKELRRYRRRTRIR